MRTGTTIMARLKKWFVAFIWLLSEIESLVSKPGSPLWWRRRFLKINGVHFGRHLFVGRTFFLVRSGNLSLGDRCALGEFCSIENFAPITIGDDFVGALRLTIVSGGHDTVTMKPICRPIRIGNRVWCGVNVTILAGVTIGDDVVVGAGSVVCRDIPSNSIAVGVPARVIKRLDRPPGTVFTSWVDDGW